eukprot:CAMPEP_0179132680 /NCGR_PEP_ID=MMETSP0796-20121207/63071_1 /TAXON_ID=73915 /ORGANISM="Pyrodinium bahamense, Strain pbaha01" /LENGTH=96 /DNA_ID=CAMNT_0020831631 /DNA_START=331 /DNA_END=621 /DNA_ORIENTATION=+
MPLPWRRQGALMFAQQCQKCLETQPLAHDSDQVAVLLATEHRRVPAAQAVRLHRSDQQPPVSTSPRLGRRPDAVDCGLPVAGGPELASAETVRMMW